MRTEEEIKTAVDRLVLNMEKSPRYNILGHDNHARIDATIMAIHHNLSYEEIEEKFPHSDEEGEINEILKELYLSAMDGRSWLDGEAEIEDLLFPEYE